LKRTPVLNIEFIKDREMTDSEIESVALLLFGWWRRDFENTGMVTSIGDKSVLTASSAKNGDNSGMDSGNPDKFRKKKKSPMRESTTSARKERN
jgi:hypothetical protein